MYEMLFPTGKVVFGMHDNFSYHFEMDGRVCPGSLGPSQFLDTMSTSSDEEISSGPVHL